MSFDLIGTIVFALILIRRPLQLAHIKTNKINEVVVLLKKLNEAVVLVKIYSPAGETKSNKYQKNTNVNNKHNKHKSHGLLMSLKLRCVTHINSIFGL